MKLTFSVSGLIVIGLVLRLTLGAAIDVAVRMTEVPDELTGGAV
jgi:hypothetical protein